MTKFQTLSSLQIANCGSKFELCFGRIKDMMGNENCWSAVISLSLSVSLSNLSLSLSHNDFCSFLFSIVKNPNRLEQDAGLQIYGNGGIPNLLEISLKPYVLN